VTGWQFIRQRIWLALLLGLAFPLVGCVHVPPPASPAQVQSLQTTLRQLHPEVSAAEAALVAAVAYDYPRHLAQQYRLVRPPLGHNLLINVGLKRRGLCYHWAEDLAVKLRTLELTSLELHWGVARPGSWREHNTVVVTARAQPFAAGVVLDPWRRSGELVWGGVTADRYPWREGWLPWEMVSKTAAR
jgi:hypothetical protein